MTHKTITLDTPLTFAEALQHLLNGKCIGIRPGNNTNYVGIEFHFGQTDGFIGWMHNGKISDSNIRINQYLETWYPVIIDHRTLAS